MVGLHFQIIVTLDKSQSVVLHQVDLSANDFLCIPHMFPNPALYQWFVYEVILINFGWSNFQ